MIYLYFSRKSEHLFKSNIKKKLIIILLLILLFFIFRRFQKFAKTTYKNFYDEKLTDESKSNFQNKPKISVIIPIYNGGKYLIYSLKSVLSQNMKDIEIIIIDDNSTDDSVKIIRNYMKKDERIKLIENKDNRKILFSKSIGALNSKGKYIIELDQDDMFIRNDAFNIIYKESEKNDIDVLNFASISGRVPFRKKKIYHKKLRKNILMEQPRLKLNIFKANNMLLWGNLFNADLYKKVIYYLWPIIINYKIIFQEDLIITFFIMLYSKKLKKINNFLLFHFINKKSASQGFRHNREFLLSVIFAANIYYDFDIDFNPKDIPIIINYIKFIPRFFKPIKKLFPSFFNFFFGKLMTNPLLSLKDKKYLMKKFKIKKNCGHYGHINLNQKLILNEVEIKKDISKYINQTIQISIIIIIQSNFENISKLINLLNSQNSIFFEIIFVFDSIKKNILILLLKYLRKFQYIKLINNNIKRGKINSISKGIMIAKGKYILILDEKSLFFDRNFLKTIYDIIENNELDILEFDLYKIIHNNYINLYKCKHYSSKFHFTKIKYNLKINNIDINKELLTNKIIKTNYLRNCLIKYKLNEINEIIDNYYNEIYIFILESNTHKYNHTSSVKLYKNNSDFDKFKFNNFSSSNEQLIKEVVFYINFIFDNSKDTYEEKESVLNEFFNVLNIIFNKFTKTSESSIKLFKKFMNCDFISDKNKILLDFYIKSLIN